MNYLELFLKTAGLYFILIIVLRVLGKREVGQLSIFDLVVLLIIADIGSIGIDNNEFVIPSYFCVLVIVFFQKILSMILLKKSIFRGLIDGEPIIIVLDGKINYKNMRKEKYTIDDLVTQMRLEHIMDISEIKLAILETSGNLSVFRSSQFDMVKLPVILSGRIVNESLEVFGYSKDTFVKMLEQNEINYKKVLYCSISFDELLFYKKISEKDIELKPHKLALKHPRK